MAVIGLNNNVERNGIVHHIQTEDSGLQNPHIFTHLFVNGVILSTKRISYEHLLQREDLQRCIQTLMRWQHRQMYQELMRGAFDAPLIDSDQLQSVPSGEFAVLQDVDATIVAKEEFHFGARLITARSLAEVAVSFMKSWQTSGHAGVR